MDVVEELWPLPRWTQARGRIGKYHQSRDWISRSANRHSGITFGCAPCWQRRFFCRHNHFRGDDAGVVSRLHALPCLAADTRKMRSTGVRSFCDLSPDRGDVHAVHARSTPRAWGWSILGLIWALAIFGII